MFAKHDSMIWKEWGPRAMTSHWASTRWEGGVLEAALSGNSPVLKANPELSTVSETCYKTSWQYITETWELFKAFVTLVAGNKLEEFGELQSYIIVLSLETRIWIMYTQASPFKRVPLSGTAYEHSRERGPGSNQLGTSWTNAIRYKQWDGKLLRGVKINSEQ